MQILRLCRCLVVATTAVALLGQPHVEARRMISRRLAKPSASADVVEEVLVDPQAQFLSQMRATIKQGRFQRANRSLEQMQSEANEFLEQQSQQFPNIGFAVSVVYQDKMVFSRGYGAAAWQVPDSQADGDTIFQIGSFSKSFLAVGVGILVDDGRVQWNDPVKKHLPWLQLVDKYMEEHVTIGDLLAMNSGFGAYQGDEIDFFGAVTSERATVERLRFLPPAGTLRDGHTYVNINFAILGQVIEEVAGKSWAAFLRERIWTPLGMTRTFASMKEAGSDVTNVAGAHFVCGSKTKGPFELTSRKADLAPAIPDGNLAAGSIVSTVTDLAKFGRLLLGDGTVDGVTILNNSEILDQMTTGKEEANPMFQVMYATAGLLSSSTRGVAGGPGYGFDAAGQLLWDRAYFDKGGDTFCHQTRNGYLPDDQIGVVVVRNAQGSETMRTDSVRSYIAGIFLDIPKPLLDTSFNAGVAFSTKMARASSTTPESEKCGPEFIDSSITSPVPDAASWIGSYTANNNPDYYGSLTLSVAANGDLELQFGTAVGSLRVLDRQLSRTMGNATQYRVLFDAPVSVSSIGYLGVINGTRAVEYNNMFFVQS